MSPDQPLPMRYFYLCSRKVVGNCGADRRYDYPCTGDHQGGGSAAACQTPPRRNWLANPALQAQSNLIPRRLSTASRDRADRWVHGAYGARTIITQHISSAQRLATQQDHPILVQPIHFAGTDPLPWHCTDFESFGKPPHTARGGASECAI
jgi:hypothetical protein